AKGCNLVRIYSDLHYLYRCFRLLRDKQYGTAHRQFLHSASHHNTSCSHLFQTPVSNRVLPHGTAPERCILRHILTVYPWLHQQHILLHNWVSFSSNRSWAVPVESETWS